MAEIFHIENSQVRPTIEILLIHPFGEIWDRDVCPKKSTALKEFSYIEFLLSPKKTNPFAGYKEELKSDKIIESLFKGEPWQPDTLVKLACEEYTDFLKNASPSWRYYMAVRASVENVREFLETVDLQERNEKGMPVYKINDVINAQTKANEVLKSLTDLEERVQQELFESSRTKAGKEINHFEK